MITQADDRPHEHGGERGWQERLTFDLHDPVNNYFVAVVMTHMPGDRKADASVELKLPGGETAQSLHRAQNPKRAEHTVGRLAIDIEDPLKRLRLSCKDTALVLPGGEQRGVAAPLDLALEIEALGDADGTTDRKTEINDQRFMSVVSRGRFTQSIRASGTLKLGTNEIAFNAVGTRTRAWGILDA